MSKRNFAFIACAVAALALAACDDAPESGRAIVSVSEINGGAPVTASVAAATDIAVPMEFRWRPYNDYVLSSEATPHGDIIIESFTITWTGPDGSTAIPARTEAIAVFVPVYDLVTSQIRIATAAELGSVTGAPVLLTAHVDFKAREMGNDHEIEFSTSFTANFAN